MKLKYIIVLVNLGLAVVLAALWAGTYGHGKLSIKQLWVPLGFIALIAAPIDLVIGLLLLLLVKKTEWRKGFFLSAAILAAICALVYAGAASLSTK
jgi:hypothetical protein